MGASPIFTILLLARLTKYNQRNHRARNGAENQSRSPIIEQEGHHQSGKRTDAGAHHCNHESLHQSLLFAGRLLIRHAGDVHLIARLDQFEALADLQFLLGGVIDEPVDALPLTLNVLVQQQILVFELLNGVLLVHKRSNTARSSQRDYCITGDCKESQHIRNSDQRRFHATNEAWKIMVPLLSAFVGWFFRMAEEIVILCTCPSREESEKLARHLLERRLAACVSILPGCQSHYWWQGAIETSNEFLILIKSQKTLFPSLEKAIHECHSYEVPEILALPVTAGSDRYLQWLSENLRLPK